MKISDAMYDYIVSLNETQLRTALLNILDQDAYLGTDSMVGYREAEDGAEECLYWRTTGDSILEG